MKGLIVTGGRPPESSVRFVEHEQVFVCAADSGYETARKLGIRVDLVVGDMDSISDKSLLNEIPSSAIEGYPSAKDLTDTEIAMKAIQDRGIEDVTIVGGGGGRLDHLIGLLRLFERPFYPRCWVTDKETVYCFEERFQLEGARGETVSVFPVGIGPVRARSEGLRWPLNDLAWDHQDVGISNEVTEDLCRLEVDQGRLLLVRTSPPVVQIP